MIVKTRKGWVAYTDDKVRKPGGPYSTRAEADAAVAKPKSEAETGGPYGGKQRKD